MNYRVICIWIGLLSTTASALPSAPLCGKNGRSIPCICASAAPPSFAYSPSIDKCDSNAAIILSGELKNAFSAVVRDRANHDRWPYPEGINGCTVEETTKKGLNRCSAFKAQKILRLTDKTIFCLGAKGSSPLMSDIVRATIKLTDHGPIYYQCLDEEHPAITPIN